MNPFFLRTGRWMLALLVSLTVACKKADSGGEPLKKLFEVPAFKLAERSGEPFDVARLRGKVWVANFFFASCPGPCLSLNQQMQSIHAATAGLPGVELLSISTDEEDTPERLNVYARQFNADARWSFVTGKKDEVFDLSIKGFKLALADAPGVNVAHKFIHSTKLVLVDKQGWIRGYYDGLGERSEADKTRLLADIKRLLEER